jgi:DNA-binding HxlR family transcriptional regulator
VTEEQLRDRFLEFAGNAAKFSHQVTDLIVPGGRDRFKLAAANLEISKTIFGKWCIEIFVILYNLGPNRFEELRRKLGGITPRVLSRKLKMMEDQGLVQRTMLDSRGPPGVLYDLTDNGVTVARLGTPVFLFLTFKGPPDSLPEVPSQDLG